MAGLATIGLFSAREASGEVEFSSYRIPNEEPSPQPPHGVHHHFCRLAIVELHDEKLKVIQDCRQMFRPLTALRDEPEAEPRNPSERASAAI
jgi:hypothetical protein